MRLSAFRAFPTKKSAVHLPKVYYLATFTRKVVRGHIFSLQLLPKLSLKKLTSQPIYVLWFLFAADIAKQYEPNFSNIERNKLNYSALFLHKTRHHYSNPIWKNF